MPNFRNKKGLTPYAFACGYQQVASVTRGGVDISVTLERDGACWHVKVYDAIEHGRLVWESFDGNSLTAARTYWKAMVREHLGEFIKPVQKDRRYRVNREYGGEPEPMYVVRFCGESVAKSETQEGAWGRATDHNATRLRITSGRLAVERRDDVLVSPVARGGYKAWLLVEWQATGICKILESFSSRPLADTALYNRPDRP